MKTLNQALFALTILATAWTTAWTTFAFAGPLVSVGGVGDSRVIVCQEKRGNFYSYFSVARTANSKIFAGEYLDRKNTNGKITRLTCIQKFQSGFECTEHAGEGALSASVYANESSLQVEVSREGYADATVIDQIACQKQGLN